MKKLTYNTRQALKRMGFEYGNLLYPEECLERGVLAACCTTIEDDETRFLLRIEFANPGSDKPSRRLVAGWVRKFRSLLARDEKGDWGRHTADAFLTQRRLVQVCQKMVKVLF